MIIAQNLAKRFRQFQAVQDVSFQARDGEVFALLGPNGAGKTTTLRMLSTVVTPSGGTASVDGHDIQQHKDAVRSRLGILVESAGLYAHSTPREHLRYIGHLHGLDGADLEKDINYWLKRLGMEDFADRYAKGFSRGMVRKVVLGMALIHNPRNVILDEPTQGLDVVSTRAVRDIIRDFKAEGRCVILSTHHMDEVERLCDRVAIIHRGQVRAEGTPHTLLAMTGASDLEEAFVQVIGETALLEEAKREAQREKKKSRAGD
jgi:sodium transport system ATP-binding protein